MDPMFLIFRHAAAREASTRLRVHLVLPALIALGTLWPARSVASWDAPVLGVVAPVLAIWVAASSSGREEGPSVARLLGRMAVQVPLFALAALVGTIRLRAHGGELVGPATWSAELGFMNSHGAFGHLVAIAATFALATAARTVVSGPCVLGGPVVGVGLLTLAGWAGFRSVEGFFWALTGLGILAAVTWEVRPRVPVIPRVVTWVVAAGFATACVPPLGDVIRTGWLVYATSDLSNEATLLSEGPDSDTVLLLASRNGATLGRAVLWRSGVREPLEPRGVLQADLGPRGAVELLFVGLFDTLERRVRFADGTWGACDLPLHRRALAWRPDGQGYVALTSDGAHFADERCSFMPGIRSAAYLGSSRAWTTGPSVVIEGESVGEMLGETVLVSVGAALFAVGDLSNDVVLSQVRPEGLETRGSGNEWLVDHGMICVRGEPGAPIHLYGSPGPATCWHPDVAEPFTPSTGVPDGHFDSSLARILPDGRMRRYQHFGYFERGSDGTVTAWRWGVTQDQPAAWTGDTRVFDSPLSDVVW